MQSLQIQTGCSTLDFKRWSEGTPSQALKFYPAAWETGNRYHQALESSGLGMLWSSSSLLLGKGHSVQRAQASAPGLEIPGLTLPVSCVDLLCCC